jgi:NADH-quinone oxidoreductase subunit L
MTALPYLWLVPGFPLLGAAAMLFWGRPLDSNRSRSWCWPDLICTSFASLSFVVAVACAVELYVLPASRYEVRGPQWFLTGEWGLLLDRLSAELMLLVSGIGALIHVYSISYMQKEESHYRFFGGLNFFVAMMQILVLSNNYLLLFAGWEGVGLASYLLIGFHYQRWRAAVAAMKAIVINRAADAAMILAVIYLSLRCGTTRFEAIAASSTQWTDIQITLAASLLLVGAMGKSAQFPLHIWLPDAMEGPTPVSALIHSATMVCAGVYLIARSGFIFHHAPEVSLATAIIGAITALIAATIALVENDIKRVLAYSTISQIGFMFVALGVGAYTAALFHLFTHAFFKSLLFLGAGSLIHALHGEQNLKHMGGLRGQLPATFKTMVLASLSLSAVPGFAGFFSKDAILASTSHVASGWVFLLFGLLTSLLTAGYTWRLLFLAFYGAAKQRTASVSEAPALMRVPMYLLGFGCVFAGWVPSLIHWSEWPLMVASALLAAAGIGLAWRYYIVVPERRATWDTRLGGLIHLLRNRWFIDALYEEKILNGIILRLAGGATEIDVKIVDGSVNGFAWLTRGFSKILRWFDKYVVDGAVTISSTLVRSISAPVRSIQTGLLQTYALLFIAGLVIVLGYYATH